MKLADLSSSKTKIINFDSGTVILSSALYFLTMRHVDVLFDDTMKLLSKLKTQCADMSKSITKEEYVK